MDMSAKANVKYVPIKGRLEFKSDEIEREIKVQIINDDAWDTTLDFAVVLTDPSQGACLSESLDLCRIKILDNDAFPSNRFRNLCEQNRFSEIPPLAQLYEYAKMNFRYPSIRRGALVILFFSFVENLLIIADLLLSIYIVDVILVGPHGDHSTADLARKSVELIVVGSLHFLPEGLVLVMDRVKERLRIAGKARRVLQSNILRKFLNYSDPVRITILESDLIMSITEDCPEVVGDGLFPILKLAQDVSMLFMLFAYQMIMAFSKAGESPDILMIAPVAVPTFAFPLLMYAFFRHRERVTTHALLKRDFARNEFARIIEMIVRNARLILDMSQRNAAIKECESSIESMNGAIVQVDSVHAANRSFAPILTDVVTAIFIMIGGHLVLQAHMSLGQFLTNIAVYGQARACWSSVYRQLLRINDALPALEQVSRHLNLPIDLHERRRLGNIARETNSTEREIARKVLYEAKQEKKSCALYAVDTIPLKLCDVGYIYRQMASAQTVEGGLSMEVMAGHTSYVKRTSLLQSSSLEKDGETMNWNLSIPQASIFALTGKHGDGKSTLLKVIGGVLLPTSGHYFVPPQLRVCHVSDSVLFLHRSLKENLLFGLSPEDKQLPGQVDRAKTICRMLGISDAILEALSSDEAKDWHQLLSISQRKKLHLARGFIANPEVLTLDRPTAGFDLKTAMVILDMMKEHVRCKGLIVSDKDSYIRRPRTIVFSTDRPEACAIADLIYVVKRSQVRQVQHAEISHVMVDEDWD
jgi:ABC-type multidrug transport system fused ATPase/permease subunit